MAKVISDANNGSYDGNLSTANGFYRVEASNLGNNSYTTLSLSSARTIDVTFANAGNCQGVVLALNAQSVATSAQRGVKVSLQENSGGWTTRVSKTLSAADIAGGSTYVLGQWVVPFKFASPYAVTTASSTWRFYVEYDGASGSHWELITSNGTSPFYATWCDNAVTWASGDVLVAMDEVTIDQSCTFNGLLEGSASYETAIVLCTNSTIPTSANSVANLSCYTPAASYTVTVKGEILLPAHSAIRFGTSASPISFSEQLILDFSTFDVSQYCRISCPYGAGNGNSRGSVWMYGVIPTYQYATLSQDEASGQAVIHTNETTGWTIGDKIYVGKCDSTSYDTTARTISNISGTTITLSSNLSSYTRKEGGTVFCSGSYGIKIVGRNNSNTRWYIYRPANFVFSGVYFDTFYGIQMANSTIAAFEDSAYTDTYEVKDCTMFGPYSSAYFLTNAYIPINDFEIARVYTVWNAICYGWYTSKSASLPQFNSGTLDISYCRGYAAGYFIYGASPAASISVTNMVTENIPYPFYSTTYDMTFTDNYIWGASTSGISIFMATNLSTFARNTYNKCTRGIYIYIEKVALGTIDTDSVFGDEAANTTDVSIGHSSYFDYELASPTGNVSVDNADISLCADGSHFKITEYNNTSTDDRGWLPYGEFQRCNAALSDTTVRTAGGSSIRFKPTSSTLPLKWEQIVPTGNIQNKTMNVNVWIKINHANYYAGTHTNPTLTINYDNGTTATAVATNTTDWQQLNVSFTPTTTYGKIKVKISGATDATTTQAYFYVDDMNIAYPAGVNIDLGALDIWVNGLPVMPTIATMPSLAGVWDEQISAHVASGSFGKLAQDTEKKVDDAGVMGIL